MFRRLLLATAASLLAATAAQGEWYEASSKHFVVYSDDSRERVTAYTQRLERFDAAVRLLHKDGDPERGAASRVIVYVVAETSDVARLAGRSGVAGFWNPQTTPVVVMPRNTGGGSTYGFTAQAVMFHEYTHHWMLTSWSDAAIPAWYAEGMAEFHATAQIRPDGSVLFGSTPTWRTYGIDQLRGQMPVPNLLRAVPGRLSPVESEALYARGWLLTHYLTMDVNRRKLLSDYIVAITNGRTPNEAASILGNVSDLRLDSYARQPKFPSILLPADQLKVGTVTVRALTPGEAATVPVLLRSKSGVNKNTALQVAGLARQLAVRFPTDAAVHNELAEAEFDVASLGKPADAAAGYQRAIAAADRAIAADPKSVHALIYHGMALEAIARDAKQTDAATWTEVRRWYLRANRADTENAEPLLRFYETFGYAKQTPTAGAETGAIYAYALAPHYDGARFAATKVYLSQAKLRQARTAFAPLAYSGDRKNKELADVLAAIDANDATAALAAIKKMEDKAEEARAKARAA